MLCFCFAPLSLYSGRSPSCEVFQWPTAEASPQHLQSIPHPALASVHPFTVSSGHSKSKCLLRSYFVRISIWLQQPAKKISSLNFFFSTLSSQLTWCLPAGMALPFTPGDRTSACSQWSSGPPQPTASSHSRCRHSLTQPKRSWPLPRRTAPPFMSSRLSPISLISYPGTQRSVGGERRNKT